MASSLEIWTLLLMCGAVFSAPEGSLPVKEDAIVPAAVREDPVHTPAKEEKPEPTSGLKESSPVWPGFIVDQNAVAVPVPAVKELSRILPLDDKDDYVAPAPAVKDDSEAMVDNTHSMSQLAGLLSNSIAHPYKEKWENSEPTGPPVWPFRTKQAEMENNKEFAKIIGRFITDLLQIPILLMKAFSDTIVGVTSAKPSTLLVPASGIPVAQP